MSEKKQPSQYPAPIPDSTYQTGFTAPPKSHMGIVAFLLSATIFLCGVSTISSLMRINLLQSMLAKTEKQKCAMAFSSPQAAPAEANQPGLEITGQALSPFWQRYHNLPRGVYVSSSGNALLQPGDILISLDNAPVNDLSLIHI